MRFFLDVCNWKAFLNIIVMVMTRNPAYTIQATIPSISEPGNLVGGNRKPLNEFVVSSTTTLHYTRRNYFFFTITLKISCELVVINVINLMKLFAYEQRLIWGAKCSKCVVYCLVNELWLHFCYCIKINIQILLMLQLINKFGGYGAKKVI